MRGSKMSNSDFEHKLLDDIIVDQWDKLVSLDQLEKLTGVYKPRLLWRIKVLADRGYIVLNK